MRRTQPENVFWCDGSEEENAYLLGEAERQGIVTKLNEAIRHAITPKAAAVTIHV